MVCLHIPKISSDILKVLIISLNRILGLNSWVLGVHILPYKQTWVFIIATQSGSPSLLPGCAPPGTIN